MHRASLPLTVAVLQHVPFEGPARIRTWFEGRGHRVDVCHLWNAAPLPRVESTALLVVMGGPMSVSDTERHPWLTVEIELLRHALEEDVPVLGVCLGAQLLAAALGARVYPAAQKEIGWWPVTLDPLFGSSRATVLHWHGDTFDLPPGARRVASSPVCPNQAFLAGSGLGLQFHLESTTGSVRRLARACSHEIGGGTYQVRVAGAAAALERGALRHAGENAAILDRVLERLERDALARRFG
ncbi:MAG: type 1 glutamine amidotransferase [Spirochaetota bacterium]